MKQQLAELKEEMYSVIVVAGWRRLWHPTPVLLPGKSHGRRAWWAVVHGVAKSRTWLSDFTFPFHFHALEKEMATHSSVLAWRIPGTEEPGGLPSMGSHRAGHDWSDLAAAAVIGSFNTLLSITKRTRRQSATRKQDLNSIVNQGLSRHL